MIHPSPKLHHVFHGLVGLWASLPCPQITYPPQVQLGPNLVNHQLKLPLLAIFDISNSSSQCDNPHSRKEFPQRIPACICIALPCFAVVINIRCLFGSYYSKGEVDCKLSRRTAVNRVNIDNILSAPVHLGLVES